MRNVLTRHAGLSKGTFVLILLLGVFTALAVGQPIVNAATVTQPLTLTEQVAGAPGSTWSVSGCGVSPTTLPDDGVSRSFTATGSCLLTITQPPPVANSRYVTTAAAISYTVTTCMSGTCLVDTHSDWFQLQNTFQVTAKAQAAFDSGMSWTVTGTYLGAGGSTICTISSTTAPTDSCTAWADYNGAVTIPQVATSPPANTRWYSLAACSFTQTTAGNTNNCNSYKQVSESLDFSSSDSSSGYAPPLISCTLYGSSTTCGVLSTTLNPFWFDYGSYWGVPNPLIGSSSSTRWETSVFAGAASAGGVLTIPYYHQYSTSFSYSVSGGGSGYTAPNLSYVSLGSRSFSALQSGSTQFWCDAGSSWSVPGTLTGSTANERWTTSATASGIVSSSQTYTLAYVHQYSVSFTYTIADGGSGYVPPKINFTQFGNVLTGTQGWADAGTKYSYTNPLVGSTSSERWDSNSSQAVISSSATIAVTFYHQYAFTVSFRVLGGGTSFAAPRLSSSSFGVVSFTSLSGTASPYWLDAGTPWSIDKRLLGSTVLERWITLGTTSGTAATPDTFGLAYYHQYLTGISYSVLKGGSPSAPTLQFVTFGSGNSTALTSQVLNFWSDSGSQWTLPRLLPGSNSQERWIASGNYTGSVKSHSAYNIPYYHQFFLVTGENTAAGGVFTNSTGWFDNGSTVRVNATAELGWKFAYWKGSGPGSYNGTLSSALFSVNGPTSETAVFHAGLTIATDSQGSVAYSQGSLRGNVSAGSQKVIYVPPGSNVTLKAIPGNPALIFSSWSQGASGSSPEIQVKVNGPMFVMASFGADYTDIQVFAASLIVVGILAMYVFVVRRSPKPRT
jgi:hypothetical protein